jgi:hypothetical protein
MGAKFGLSPQERTQTEGFEEEGAAEITHTFHPSMGHKLGLLLLLLLLLLL